MNYLLDTHSLIWFLSGDERLSRKAQNLMSDETNGLFVSIVSLWEIAIKASIGKLNLERPFEYLFPQQLIDNSIDVLPLAIEHLTTVGKLPFHHRDPFDRVLIAQSLVEDLTLIGTDEQFDAYRVRREW